MRRFVVHSNVLVAGLLLALVCPAHAGNRVRILGHAQDGFPVGPLGPRDPVLRVLVGVSSAGLTPADFILKIDDGGQLTQIGALGVKMFRQTGDELDVVILVEDSVLVTDDVDLRAAIDAIATTLSPNTKLGLFVYGDQFEELVPMGDPGRFRGSVLLARRRANDAGSQRVGLGRGLYVARNTLANLAGRRVRLLIGSGEDEDEALDLKKELTYLQDSEVEVYVLSAGSQAAIPGKRLEELGRLGELVAPEPRDRVAAATALAREMDDAYMVVFPGMSLDGRYMPFDQEEHDTLGAGRGARRPVLGAHARLRPGAGARQRGVRRGRANALTRGP